MTTFEKIAELKARAEQLDDLIITSPVGGARGFAIVAARQAWEAYYRAVAAACAEMNARPIVPRRNGETS